MPDWSSREWGTRVDEYYGVPPYWVCERRRIGTSSPVRGGERQARGDLGLTSARVLTEGKHVDGDVRANVRWLSCSDGCGVKKRALGPYAGEANHGAATDSYPDSGRV